MIKTPVNILVVRFSAIGDVAMSSHALLKLTKTYPNIKVTVLSKDFMGPLFEDIPHVNFFPADTSKTYKGLFGLFRLAMDLKKLNFDAIADIHYVLRSRIVCFFMSIISPKTIIIHINKNRKGRKLLTRATNKVFTPLKKTHLRYADVFKKLGLPIEMDDSDILPKRQFSNSKLSFSGKKVGIAPFAAFKGKSYPFTQMEEVIKYLSKNQSVKIFLFGGKEDMVKLSLLDKKYKHVTAVGKLLTFKDELSVISNLDLMISMDSANVHLAGMYGLPTLTIWGITHPYCGFEVFGNNNTNLIPNREKYPLIPTSIYGDFAPKNYINAIASITPKDITDKVFEILK